MVSYTLIVFIIGDCMFVEISSVSTIKFNLYHKRECFATKYDIDDILIYRISL